MRNFGFTHFFFSASSGLTENCAFRNPLYMNMITSLFVTLPPLNPLSPWMRLKRVHDRSVNFRAVLSFVAVCFSMYIYIFFVGLSESKLGALLIIQLFKITQNLLIN